MNSTTTTTTATVSAGSTNPASYHWKPLNVGRWIVWGGFALLLFIAPKLFTSGTSLTMLSQMGYLVIVCLSYNLLLGQGGMLSFGHAVYTGLGAFFAIHAMNLASSGSLPIPLPFIPLVGGMAGLAVAAILGYPSTKKAGTPFAMITLGVGELVYAMSLMFPDFFGGEGGISGNRVYDTRLFGWSFGPAEQVYYLIAVYCFVCTGAMYAFTRTPLGRMLNAVRDNPERVAFIGYDTRRVRYLAFMIAGFFAGIGGAFNAINFEIVTAETVSAVRSGGYLLFTFLGGATFFFGPIIGAVLLVFSSVLLSEMTLAWQIYLGFVFLFMVMYAPGGVASLIMMNLRVAAFGKLGRLWTAYLALGGAGAVLLAAVACVVEIIYHLQLDSSGEGGVRFLGTTLQVGGTDTWVGLALVSVTALGLFELVRRRFLQEWGETQAEIEKEIKRREAQL
ncbi:MAG TPA: branched-chain amino acid ABC transporter permease [Ideonella sp.]|uniref:branched-chain amino acid ABC transporter permease n=1 Tax=Ideonella sp. TaxID=1929293 RepID=UPI002E2F9307|nr:branched-chain amino acid ABC transporter permease [Ideonella sp.]HEX5685927.1 branched-chain amino acid ABC transporter permease [Ideonella sp.]